MPLTLLTAAIKERTIPLVASKQAAQKSAPTSFRGLALLPRHPALHLFLIRLHAEIGHVPLPPDPTYHAQSRPKHLLH